MSDLTEAVRCALANITPGPWSLRGYDDVVAARDEGMGPRLVVMVPAYSPEDSANLKLVASAPTWLAELCDRLDDAEAEIERRVGVKAPPGSPTPATREGVAATSKATPSQHAGRDVDG